MAKRRLLVTGGSRGIGRAVCELLEDEYEIIAPKRDELDLADGDSIAAFAARCPDLDALVNAAGVNILGSLDQLDDRRIAEMQNVNLIAPLKLIRGAVPGMRRRGGGRIVNFASIWGVRSKELRTLYSMAKFGVVGMTRSLARELGGDNILVNSISPGYVLTEMTMRNVPEDERKKLCGEIPLGRMAEPREIAKAVRFLISEDNSYMTGVNMLVDGGFLA